MWPLPTESKTKEVPLTEVAATAKGVHFDKESETNCYFLREPVKNVLADFFR